MLFHVGYLTTMKYSVTYADVTPIDHMLVIAIFGFTCDLLVAKCMGYSLSVDKEVKCALYCNGPFTDILHNAQRIGSKALLGKVSWALVSAVEGGTAESLDAASEAVASMAAKGSGHKRGGRARPRRHLAAP